jgi:hypothetical protein
MDRSTRYRLLPLWLRFFAGVYFIGGIFGAGIYAYLWVTEPTLRLKFNLFGQTYPADIHSWISVGSYALGFVMIFGAYGLLWGRRWARVFALVVCYLFELGWAVSLFAKARTGSMAVSPVEPLLFAFAIFSLHRLKRGWNAPPVPPPSSSDRAAPLPA